MKIIIYGLILLAICNHLITMSVTRNKTSSKAVRSDKNTTRTTQNGNTSILVKRKYKVRVLRTRTSAVPSNNTFCMKETSTIKNISKDLVTQSTTVHMLQVPNTRLHEVILRTPFILTYDQRDVLTRVVKKLWWNCR